LGREGEEKERGAKPLLDAPGGFAPFETPFGVVGLEKNGIAVDAARVVGGNRYIASAS